MSEDFVPKDKWEIKQRPNLTAKIPYAYKLDPDNRDQFIPNLDIIIHLEKAFDYIDAGNPLRKVTDWLVETTGKKLTFQGLDGLWQRMRGSDKTNPRVKELRKAQIKRRPRTKEEAQEREAKRKLATARRSATMQARKIAKIKAGGVVEQAPIPHTIYSYDDHDISAIAKKPEQEIIFQPNPGPQTEFLAAAEQEVLYGGAAGGGKSFALLADPMRYFDNKNFNGIILRRTNDELRELKWKSRELYPKAFPGAKWREKDSLWVFPSGAQLWLTYLERDEDVLRYQGQAFSYIGIDELTQYATDFAWNYMRSRLRSIDPTLPLFMRATCNPGGPGHLWVKRTFIDPAPHGRAFPATDIATGAVLTWQDGNSQGHPAGTPLFYRRFIPARLSDNPYLYKDGQYEANLLSLPEMQRRRLLDGDWNLAEGAAFPEFRVKTHVVEPFKIPSGWRRFRSCDYGYSSFSAVHWFAIDPQYEQLIVYRELYVSKMTGRDLAKEIMKIERDADENMLYGILDSSVWHQRGHTGPSIAEEMISEGVRWRPSDRTGGARINGKNRLHEVLKVTHYEDREVPGIVFFNTCSQIVADMQVIPSDPKGGEDIDDRYASDHAYDSVRYGVMSRPKGSSPFDMSRSVIIPSYRPADSQFGY